MPRPGSTGVFEKHPSAQTILFGGKHINLRAISRAQNISVSYLSFVFRGQRNLSLLRATQIAAILGMSMDEFVQAMEIRLKEYRAREAAVFQMHEQRINKEDIADLKKLEAGLTPAPRLPALRIA